MANYKTYRKEKWLFFCLAWAAYIIPVVVTTSIYFPMIQASTGTKIGLGAMLVIINVAPASIACLRSFLVKYPMFNVFALMFLILSAFFTMDAFQYYVQIFEIIESAALLGCTVWCILWHYYRKFGGWHESIRANVKSGAFVMKESDSK